MFRTRVADIEPREVLPGYRARFVHSERTTHAYWEIDGGVPLPEHAHPHEQIVNMLEGEYELSVGGEAHVLRAGDVLVIPPGVPHSGRSLTDCRILDVFAPVREDYL
ncbi:MAG: cupin domain-containing protein [Gemmatimonadetes bacterium]|nr:MAG: cupin domain-containing protein [Gemmatimonadota bacterium]